MRRLTIKQKLFINEYVKTKNGMRSAMKVYDVKNKNVAGNIASENLNKPNIKESLGKLLVSSGYDPRLSVANLIAVEQAETKKITGADKINASKLLLQLSGYLMQTTINANYNYDLSNMDHAQLITVKEKYNKLRSKIETGK
jgi:phage terminase small subunit